MKIMINRNEPKLKKEGGIVMKRILCLLLAIVCALLAASCRYVSPEEGTEAPAQNPPNTSKIRIPIVYDSTPPAYGFETMIPPIRMKLSSAKHLITVFPPKQSKEIKLPIWQHFSMLYSRQAIQHRLFPRKSSVSTPFQPTTICLK